MDFPKYKDIPSFKLFTNLHSITYSTEVTVDAKTQYIFTMASMIIHPRSLCNFDANFTLTGVSVSDVTHTDRTDIDNDEGDQASYHVNQCSDFGCNHQEINSKLDSRRKESSDCGIDLLLAQSFRQLLRMYSSQLSRREGAEVGGERTAGIQDPPIIVAGGLQQYLIKNMKSTEPVIQQPRKGAGSDVTTFYDLPDSILLKIFSYMSVRELCRMSNVCRHWYCVSSDNIHWQKRLRRDIHHWDVIGHTTNPQMYNDCQSDWTNKEIYLRCSPDVNRILKQTYISFHSITNILRTFWPKKTPRIAMFGPGLESETSQIVRNILEDETGVFNKTGMFPGQFEGMGSGFTIKMSSVSFHLMTLYTSTRQERESRPREHRLRNSRLLQQAAAPDVSVQIGEDDSSDDEEYEVRKPVKDLCAAVDGFVFVIDAGSTQSVDRSTRAEFRAMINDKWVPANTPVVVMSCISSDSRTRVPCVDIVQCLKLSKLSRHWQVRNCDVGDMHGVTDAIEWVVEQAQRKG